MVDDDSPTQVPLRTQTLPEALSSVAPASQPSNSAQTQKQPSSTPNSRPPKKKSRAEIDSEFERTLIDAIDGARKPTLLGQAVSDLESKLEGLALRNFKREIMKIVDSFEDDMLLP